MFGAELARGRADQRRPGLVQGRRGRRLHRRGGALRAGRRDLRERAGGEVRPDDAVADGRPDCCRPSRAATTASRRCSAHGTSRRSSAAARRTLTHNGYQVTDANGNLVDLDGQHAHEPFSGTPGFPGFSPTASQTLAYLADMQEAGIPVTYGYISDLHERKAGHERLHDRDGHRHRASRSARATPATSTNAQAYDAAFEKFFERLAADGITPANTLFVISAEENDQFAGANVGRATAADAGRLRRRHRRRATTPTGQIGELQANIKGLLVEHGQQRHAVRHRAAGRRDLRPRPARPRTTRRSASSSATPPR